MTLKKRIINGRVMPGDPLLEDDLIRDLKTSRTPIREALMQLARESLVDIHPRKGTFVSEITVQHIMNIYQTRLIIEPQATRIVCSIVPAERLLAFRRRFSETDPENHRFSEVFRVDKDFHNFIVECSGNGYLIEIHRRLLDLNQRIQIYTGRNPQRVAEGIREHIAIIDAILDRNEDAAAESMAAHILSSRDAAFRLDGFLSPRYR